MLLLERQMIGKLAEQQPRKGTDIIFAFDEGPIGRRNKSGEHPAQGHLLEIRGA